MSSALDPRVPVALIVDDDPVLRTIGAETLRAIGFEIMEAETGEEALAMAIARTPDLVLLDLNLPGRDGFSICEAMRARSEMADVPILIVTGQTDAATIDRTFRVGATDFIKKPLDWQLVQHRVRFLMRANTAFKDLESVRSDLANSRRALHAAHEFGHIGTWELESTSGQMLWSDELHRLIGTTPNAGGPPSWETFQSLIPEEDRRRLDKVVQDVIAVRRPRTLEHRLLDVDGETRFVHQYLQVTRDVAGDPIIQGTVQDVTERRRAEAQVEYLETFDSLTQLPNRAYLHKRLERLVARSGKAGASLAILSVDLDRFDRINQALGYATGDDLLRAVAERLLDSVRSTDFVARGMELPDVSRFGGDEFTIVLTGHGPDAMARQAASRILHSLAEPFTMGEHEIALSASIGIATLSDGASDTDADALISCAGTAMTWAKTAGGAGYRFYDPATNNNAALYLALESDLAAAIRGDELTLEYQPVCDAKTGQTVLVEALVRWNHPRLGRLMPGDFIPVAESCGLVTALSEWVLLRACRQLQEWDSAGLPPIRVAANVSSLQFNQGQVVDGVRSALEKTGVAPSRLEIEITETALLGDGDQVRATCEALRELGISLSLDDFGTGYSSLSHLFQFHMDTLKIDRSFTARMQLGNKASGIIAAIIAMAKCLGITVTAEGVEEPEQERLLRDEGCQLLQGFGICRPAPPEQIAAWVLERSLGSRPASA